MLIYHHSCGVCYSRRLQACGVYIYTHYHNYYMSSPIYYITRCITIMYIRWQGRRQLRHSLATPRILVAIKASTASLRCVKTGKRITPPRKRVKVWDGTFGWRVGHAVFHVSTRVQTVVKTRRGCFVQLGESGNRSFNNAQHT